MLRRSITKGVVSTYRNVVWFFCMSFLKLLLLKWKSAPWLVNLITSTISNTFKLGTYIVAVFVASPVHIFTFAIYNERPIDLTMLIFHPSAWECLNKENS